MSAPAEQARIEALVADLRKVAAFADQHQDDLEWFVSQSGELRTPVGEITVKEGSPAEAMFVILEGELRARREMGPAGSPVYTAHAGDVTGVLPFSRMKTYSVTVRAVLPMRTLAFPASKFPELFQRMAELGKLSAGLAHELNNPSAAARRTAAALHDCLERLRSASRNSALRAEDCGLLAQREDEIRASLKPADYHDEFARADRQDAIQSWLEGRGVAEAWKLAPLLADANLTDEHLERFAGTAGAALGPELIRFATLLEMERIASELDNSTARISGLIKGIKECSFMDQAPLQEVDIKSSLETTLTIMHHKLKRGITVTREYAPDLPKVMAYGSELNQVWTNLIDNAADAMGDTGKLLVRAVRENEYVLVEIADNGPGIPSEVQSRIFEPFFTTKEVGEGTGLGLDVVHRIVQKMRGLVTVKSVPGDTRFQVRIPMQATM